MKPRSFSATGIIIDVNGVGYGLEIPLSLMSQLPSVGEPLDVWVYSYIKEDSYTIIWI